MKRINMSLLALLLAAGALIGAMENNTTQKPDWQQKIDWLQKADVAIAERLQKTRKLQKTSRAQKWIPVSLLGIGGVGVGLFLAAYFSQDSQYIGWSYLVFPAVGSVIGAGTGYAANEKLDQYLATENKKTFDEVIVMLNKTYVTECYMQPARFNPKQVDYCIKLYDVLSKYEPRSSLDEFKQPNEFWRNQKQ
jgi:hypothetical protein